MTADAIDLHLLKAQLEQMVAVWDATCALVGSAEATQSAHLMAKQFEHQCDYLRTYPYPMDADRIGGWVCIARSAGDALYRKVRANGPYATYELSIHPFMDEPLCPSVPNAPSARNSVAGFCTEVRR